MQWTENKQNMAASNLKVEYKKRSAVHEYFDRAGADKSVCKSFKIELKTQAGNTTNLRTHLSCKHRDAYEEMINKEYLSKEKKPKTVIIVDIFTLVNSLKSYFTWIILYNGYGRCIYGKWEKVRVSVSMFVIMLYL